MADLINHGIYEEGDSLHYHKDEDGILRKCYHTCKGALFSWQFWFGSVVSQVIWFPAEHLLWERVPGFDNITHWLGL